MDWEWVEGYDNGSYTDSMVFSIDNKTKQIARITGQPLISGEENSQFIKFEMPRYYDGIDLSDKHIQIIYITENGYSDINSAVCVERNDENIRFGWIVPQAATYDVGTLSFSVEFIGEGYTLKTRATDLEVYDGLNGGEIIPEPIEKVWYIELQQRCDYILDKAETAQSEASVSELNARTYMQNAQNAYSMANLAKESIQSQSEQISTNANDIVDLKQKDNEMAARLDQAISNYEGSPEGEIADARVDRNGNIYGSLGAAIRGQFDELGLYIDEDGDVCQKEE